MEMTAEEMDISRSTPNYTFDVPPPAQETGEPAVTTVSEPVELDHHRPSQYVDRGDRRFEPVVMFALEWCEFCWSVRKLFAALDIPYVSVDLDSVAYQKDDLGGRIRAVLKHRTGQPTIPQIYVGGEHVGGATDLFDECREGTFYERLAELGIPCPADSSARLDPYSLLPGWLHPRQTAA